ncbi:carboxylesterase/lipase family protein [Nocardia sp. NPDC052316]|uniref:carboxylesterase/lipase family protein n=1 Tax=Nocardia sp. NPDC052316 TaxID=3364329 RepID=UPI0037C98159
MKSRLAAGSCALAALLIAVLLTACAQDRADPAVVHTTSGAVRGAVHPDHRLFQGIPFAQPPVGELRWQPPRSAPAWSGERDATTPGSLCMQNPADPSEGPQSEDCLYLNVTTPAAKATRPRPVMVWLHGGGFYQGNAAEYGAARLASQGDVIVVTANYRLGVFGFLRLPGMADGGTFGLQDQQLALRWATANAAAFGGDPGNITLFGESAGAMSTCAQLTSPAATGLFHKVIMQSGTCMSEWPPYAADGTGSTAFDPPAYAERQGRALSESLGCPPDGVDLTCLRRAPTDRLLAGPAQFGPSYGNALLPDHPAIALREGRFARVPIILGNNRDEARVSIVGTVPSPLTAAEYRRVLDADFGTRADAVAAAYPAQAGDNANTLAQLNTDRTWAYTTRNARDALAGSVAVFAYEFADPAPPPFADLPAAPFPYGAYHGSELAYLFELPGLARGLDGAQRGLADAMIDYWSAFAHKSEPAVPDRPAWAPVAGERPFVQSLAPGPGGIGPTDFDAGHHIDFWIRLGHG